MTLDRTAWDAQKAREENKIRASSSGWATCIGVDLSYSGTGDQAAFVAVAMQKGVAWHQAQLYVRDVFAGRREIRALRRTLSAWQTQFPAAEFASFVSGTERSVLALLEEEWADDSGIRIPGVSVFPMLAVDSKRSRASATEECWNAGRLHVPRDKPWAAKTVRQIQSFTGREGDADDVIDALVSAVEFLRHQAGDWTGISMTGKRRVNF